MSSSSTEHARRRRRCPRWASRSPRARSSSGASRSATGSRTRSRSATSRPTRSTPRCPSPAAGRLAEIARRGRRDGRGRHRAGADRDRRPAGRGARERGRRRDRRRRRHERGRGRDRRRARAATPSAAPEPRRRDARTARRPRATARSCSGSPPSTASTSTQVEGTGRGGRVRKQDVLAVVETARSRGARAHRRAAAEPPLHIESPYRPDAAGARRRAGAPAAPAEPRHALADAPVDRRAHEALARDRGDCTTWIEVDMARVEARARASSA